MKVKIFIREIMFCQVHAHMNSKIILLELQYKQDVNITLIHVLIIILNSYKMFCMCEKFRISSNIPKMIPLILFPYVVQIVLYFFRGGKRTFTISMLYIEELTQRQFS